MYSPRVARSARPFLSPALTQRVEGVRVAERGATLVNRTSSTSGCGIKLSSPDAPRRSCYFALACGVLSISSVGVGSHAYSGVQRGRRELEAETDGEQHVLYTHPFNGCLREGFHPHLSICQSTSTEFRPRQKRQRSSVDRCTRGLLDRRHAFEARYSKVRRQQALRSEDARG